MPRRLWPALVLAALSGCSTTVPGSAQANTWEQQEYAACHAATDKAAKAILDYLVAADTDPLNAGDPDTAPIRAMADGCRSGRAEGMGDLIVKVSDGFTPTTSLGQVGYQGLLKSMCNVPNVPVEKMRGRAQAVCASR